MRSPKCWLKSMRQTKGYGKEDFVWWESWRCSVCLLFGMVGGPNPKAKNWLDGHGSISAGKNTNCLRVPWCNRKRREKSQHWKTETGEIHLGNEHGSLTGKQTAKGLAKGVPFWKMDLKQLWSWSGIYRSQTGMGNALASCSAGPSSQPSVPIAPFSSFFMGRVWNVVEDAFKMEPFTKLEWFQSLRGSEHLKCNSPLIM